MGPLLHPKPKGLGFVAGDLIKSCQCISGQPSAISGQENVITEVGREERGLTDIGSWWWVRNGVDFWGDC